LNLSRHEFLLRIDLAFAFLAAAALALFCAAFFLLGSTSSSSCF
jgi:hypothetical protein